MKGLRIILRWLRTTIAAFAVFAVLPPATAYAADCELTEADIAHGATGVPEDVAVKLDPLGARKALAQHGIGVGGAYYGESFGTWGGFDQGGEYRQPDSGIEPRSHRRHTSVRALVRAAPL